MPKKKPSTSSSGDKTETKAERFIRLATPRVEKAIKALKTLGNCAGSSYEYTPEQVSDLLVALGSELSALESKFEQKKSAQTAFKFDST